MHSTKNEYWVDFMEQLRPYFKLPSRKLLLTLLLDDVYGTTSTDIHQKVAKAGTIGLQCDSWSNIPNEEIVNYIVTTSEPVFFKSMPTAAHRQSSEFLTDKISEVIKEIGKKKVLALCTDNEAKVRKAWRILENKYESDAIYFYGCLAYIINLLVTDIIHHHSATRF